MKRILSVLLCAVLLLSCLPIISAGAKELNIEAKFKLLLEDLELDPTIYRADRYFYEELAQYPENDPEWVLIRAGLQDIRLEYGENAHLGTLGSKWIDSSQIAAPFSYDFGVFDIKTNAFYDLKDAWKMNFTNLHQVWNSLPGDPHTDGKAADQYLIGDADDDGYLTIVDATKIQRILAEIDDDRRVDLKHLWDWWELGYPIGHQCDFDRDGEFTIVDATAIQRNIAGLPNMIDAKLAWDERFYPDYGGYDGADQYYFINSLDKMDLSGSRFVKDSNIDPEQKIRDAYDDSFFEKNSLLVLDVSLASGSYHLTLDQLSIDHNDVLNVDFSYLEPHTITCDVNDRFICIEMSKAFVDDIRDVKVNLRRMKGDSVYGDFVYVVNADDKVEICGYRGSGGDVNIPAEIENKEVVAIRKEAFMDCTQITGVTVPDTVTSIGANAFDGCTGLEEVSLPDSVTLMEGQVFFRCKSLKSAKLPKNLTSVPAGVFESCPALTTVVMPDKPTRIDAGAFAGCSSLESIDIPDSVTTIGQLAFGNCTGLKRIDLSEHTKTIRLGAFRGCTSLESVTLPASLTRIGEEAFLDCSNLKSIVILSKETEIENYAFGYYFTKEGNQRYDGITVHGYTGSTAQTYAGENGFAFKRIDASAIENYQTETWMLEGAYDDEIKTIYTTSREELEATVDQMNNNTRDRDYYQYQIKDYDDKWFAEHDMIVIRVPFVYEDDSLYVTYMGVDLDNVMSIGVLELIPHEQLPQKNWRIALIGIDKRGSEPQIKVDYSNMIDTVLLKPIIYLYPEEETELTVTLGKPEELTCTYPAYNNGWHITAKPDGTLIDDSGRSYYALYWESKSAAKCDTSEGFVVKGEDTAAFFEEKLALLGLNEREAQEFIVYWLPQLQKNQYNFIRFATPDEINEYMPLNFSTQPDTLIRVLMQYQPLDQPIEVKPQTLTAPERKGFTAVEWGGSPIG